MLTSIVVSNEQIKSKTHGILPRLKLNAVSSNSYIDGYTPNCWRILCFVFYYHQPFLTIYLYDFFYPTDDFNLIASNFMCNNKLIVNMNLLKIVEIMRSAVDLVLVGTSIVEGFHGSGFSAHAVRFSAVCILK